MLYHLYELNHAAITPWRAAANMGRAVLSMPANPFVETPIGRTMSAGLDLFERVTRRYGKPEFGLETVEVEGESHPVVQSTVLCKPFCNLEFFTLGGLSSKQLKSRQPILIVAPMSGHYATLLRGTVEAMLEWFDVYITDWTDARQVPLSLGSFDLSDYVDYVIDFIHFIGPGTSVMAVCQPSVPVLAATAVMAQRGDKAAPKSLCLMGGPIDTRRNPTAVNDLAEKRDLEWFENNVIVKVPFPHPGFMREVYPGFLQLTGFMTMNLDRHLDAHKTLFWNMIRGDGDSTEKHDEFYDEYLAVMDLTKEFYLQTVREVFIEHALAKGTFMHHGELVDPSAIKTTALLTVEGEHDDITGLGQTEAAHDLCSNLPKSKKAHYIQKGVGHYGIFNGRRFRQHIAPKVAEFITAS